LDNRDRIVEFPQQRYTLANAAFKIKRTLGQGVLYPVRKIHLRGVDFDSQELVSWLAVSIQLTTCQHSGADRRENTEDTEDNREENKRTAPRHDIRESELIVTKEIVMTTSGVVNKQV
jgi:hypothetical protein